MGNHPYIFMHFCWIMSMDLDPLDLQILTELLHDSSISLQRLSTLFNTPKSTIHNRIKRLEQEGIISKYTVKIDYQTVGKELQAYIMISYEQNSEGKDQEQVAREICKYPSVEEVCLIAGEFDMILKVRFGSIQELSNFTIQELKEIPGVARSLTHVVLRQMKDQYQEPYPINSS